MNTATKGDRTRQAILDQAMAIASRLGMEGLTIGTLAEASGMSKSGLFAHFGSREELQVAVLEHAAARFAEMVAFPAFREPRGLPRLRKLYQLWQDWTSNAGLPGGCPLLTATFEYDDRPGPVRDTLVGIQRRALEVLEKAVSLAVAEGHLVPETPVRQLVFEHYGALLAFYHHSRLLGDEDAWRLALEAFERRMAAYLTPSAPPAVSAAAAGARGAVSTARAAAKPAKASRSPARSPARRTTRPAARPARAATRT